MTARHIVLRIFLTAIATGRRAGALVTLLWRAGRWRAGALAALAVLAGLLPPVTVLASGLLIGAVPAAVEHGIDSPQGTRALLGLALVGAGFALTGLAETAALCLGTAFGERYAAFAGELVGSVALGPPGIAELEDPRVAAELGALDGLARTGLHRQTPVAVRSLLTERLAGLGSAALLFRFSWWAPFLLCLGWTVASITGKRWFARSFGEAVSEGGKGMRRAGYFRDLGTESTAAKELHIFGLGSWLRGRYAEHWTGSMSSVWRMRRIGGIEIGIGIAALALSHGAVFGALVVSADRGGLSLDALTVFSLAALRTESLGFIGGPQLQTARAMVAAQRIVAFAERLRPIEIQRVGVGSERHAVAVAADDVTFCYPNRSLFDQLRLRIPAGQSVAIVGANGAGKSTLVKLLCGLYQPQGGQIRLDGSVPSPGDRRIAAIFQDFVRYELSLRDNVRLAPKLTDDELRAALRSAGAADLPAGADTRLSTGYAGGVELSGGQWQRVALARALAAVHSGAGLLILDEPTASLDIRAETELFDRFLELTRGVTTILVSHRLSSVRRAERIIVLHGGRIVEDGDHDSLLAANGRYADMFRLQAARFADGGVR